MKRALFLLIALCFCAIAKSEGIRVENPTIPYEFKLSCKIIVVSLPLMTPDQMMIVHQQLEQQICGNGIGRVEDDIYEGITLP